LEVAGQGCGLLGVPGRVLGVTGQATWVWVSMKPHGRTKWVSMGDNVSYPFVDHFSQPTDSPSISGAVANTAQIIGSSPSLVPKTSRGYEANLPTQLGTPFYGQPMALSCPQNRSTSSRILAGPSSIQPRQARQPQPGHHVLDAGSRITRPRRNLDPVVVPDPYDPKAVKKSQKHRGCLQIQGKAT